MLSSTTQWDVRKPRRPGFGTRSRTLITYITRSCGKRGKSGPLTRNTKRSRNWPHSLSLSTANPSTTSAVSECSRSVWVPLKNIQGKYSTVTNKIVIWRDNWINAMILSELEIPRDKRRAQAKWRRSRKAEEAAPSLAAAAKPGEFLVKAN